MKKIFLSLVLVITLAFTAGCTYTGLPPGLSFYEGVDVQYYRPALSEFSIANLVSKDFLTKFEYGDNKFYCYIYEPFLYLDVFDKSLMYLEYSDDVYEEAKDYILTEMNLDFTQEKSYNGYVFHFYPGPGHVVTIFPTKYLMAGYNDEKNRLVFLGLYTDAENHPELECGETDFGKYLQMVYGEFYDFDA